MLTGLDVLVHDLTEVISCVKIFKKKTGNSLVLDHKRITLSFGVNLIFIIPLFFVNFTGIKSNKLLNY